MTTDSAVREAQLANLSILQSMYPLPTELTLSPGTASTLAALETDPSCSIPLEILEAVLRIEIADRTLELLISFPLSSETVIITPRQPSWLSRAEFETLRNVPVHSPDTQVIDFLLESIEVIRQQVEDIVQRSSASSSSTPRAASPVKEEKLERVWFWFPSLSSKEKRRDLVEFGMEHDLTGFVLAGKPGLLCVEGSGREVDRYMSRIKSESWRDIPPAHKKVTERLRRPLTSNEDRKFSALTDVTDLVSRYGQYAHRGEMSDVKRLMEEWGVGEDFGAVVMNSGS